MLPGRQRSLPHSKTFVSPWCHPHSGRKYVPVLLTGVLYATPKPAKPEDPTTIIVDAFRTYPIVALSEGQHWNQQGHAFRMSLLRNPRLSDVVNNIVVECGDSRYQDVIDRFIAGSDVPTTNSATSGKTQRLRIPFGTYPFMRSSTARCAK